jgi:hypothetical protein
MFGTMARMSAAVVRSRSSNGRRRESVKMRWADKKVGSGQHRPEAGQVQPDAGSFNDFHLCSSPQTSGK